MEYDKEVIRDEELAAREAAKTRRFTLFKGKPTSDSKSTPPSTPAPIASTISSHSTPASASDDGDLPARIERPSSSGSKPNLGASSAADESVAHIPETAGFDFKAIAKAIGKENLEPSALPMVPAQSMPRRHPSSEPIAPERTGSAPLPLRANPPLEDCDASTPKPTTLSLPDQPSSTEDENHSLPTVFQRSLSVSDAALHEARETRLDAVLLAGDPESLLASSKRPQPPSWPPPSTLLSYASSEGSTWGSSPAFNYSTAVPNPLNTNSSPLQRQAPPSISLGALNGVTPTSTTPGPSTPELSFGSADGRITPGDGDAITRDPWAPKPIGLDAAIARKTNFTLNPWET